MAVRLSNAFGGSPESWLRQQMNYDLWRVGKKGTAAKVKKFQPA